IPIAADKEVELCPASQTSCSLSTILGTPHNPLYWRNVSKSFALPVKILWTYAWCPTSHKNLSLGLSNNLCNIIVNSTTPRFGPICPPVTDSFSIKKERISAAKSVNCSSFISFRKDGFVIVVRSICITHLQKNSNATHCIPSFYYINCNV